MVVAVSDAPSTFLAELSWLAESPADLSPYLLDWLCDQGSLTRRLQAIDLDSFTVEVVAEAWQPLDAESASYMATAAEQQVWVRDVYLHLFGQPWVQARTLVPASTLAGPGQHLQRLGDKPLGAALFRHGQPDRTPLQLGRAKATEQGEDWLWGRRSTFFLQQHPLVVMEFFLPPLLEHLQ
ncbi:hypothetical protein WH50_11605 [Pokkaliibacter plantistimulans]|uniref:Probable chorismate pyruvate-lyase n=1 Tax=Pokkaliibacter plantistimulans TaxID=1635171 RepID=A0ABX5LWX4_9GAMM|nr:hypothetical protein WH50_11605 [Pokkaliibacter plantistimulans]